MYSSSDGGSLKETLPCGHQKAAVHITDVLHALRARDMLDWLFKHGQIMDTASEEVAQAGGIFTTPRAELHLPKEG